MCIFFSIKLFFHTSVLQFLRALALHECFHKLLSVFFVRCFVSPFLFSSSISFRFGSFLLFVSSLSCFVFALSLLSSQRCWAIFQAAWFSLIWSIIIDGGSAETHTKKIKTKPRRHGHVQQRHEMRRNEMKWYDLSNFIERVPLWLLSYQRMNRNQI